MPLPLILAVAASLGLHLGVLFGSDFGLVTEPESLPVLVELRPTPKALAEPAHKPLKTRAKRKSQAPPLRPPQVYSVQEGVAEASENPLGVQAEGAVDNLPEPESEALQEEVTEDAPPPRLPERGRILYRVDRGDRGFEIGRASSEWEIRDGRYRLQMSTETTGIVWLFKDYRIDMESRGVLDRHGLRPESFSLRRNGADGGEKATFDWAHMQLSVGDGPMQAMEQGTQDLLSFNYHLGFMRHSHVAHALPIVTGRKYGIYRLEILGDEELDIPAGTMRTLHLRAPGTNTTELWLAYDYLLLPVKIRHTDAHGGSLVQTAVQIQLSPE